jgi:hypothetical protein
MKIKTQDLNGAALDWSVAKCEGQVNNGSYGEPIRIEGDLHLFYCGTTLSAPYRPSYEWAQCGPIIEREKLLISAWGTNQWRAQSYWNHGYDTFVHVPMYESLAPTPLIAAMRCFVELRIGAEVDIPEEFV